MPLLHVITWVRSYCSYSLMLRHASDRLRQQGLLDEMNVDSALSRRGGGGLDNRRHYRKLLKQRCARNIFPLLSLICFVAERSLYRAAPLNPDVVVVQMASGSHRQDGIAWIWQTAEWTMTR